MDKVWLVTKLALVLIFGACLYQFWTGDKTIQNKAVSFLEKSGGMKVWNTASRKTASTYNKVIGDDLKKGGDPIANVQTKLKAAKENLEKKEQYLKNIENQ